MPLNLNSQSQMRRFEPSQFKAANYCISLFFFLVLFLSIFIIFLFIIIKSRTKSDRSTLGESSVYSHHAQFESNAQLFQVKDKKCPRCVQRSPINWSHFKSNYVMILKTPKYLFVWIGRTSSHSERLNAFKLAAKMRSQCKQMPEMVVVDDGYEQSMSETKKKSWNEYLPLAQRIVHPSDEQPSVPVPTFRLYKCGFHNGKYRIEEIKSSILHQRDLSSSRAYIIDCGPHYGAWIWVGRYSDVKDKSEAMRNARGFVKKVKKVHFHA